MKRIIVFLGLLLVVCGCTRSNDKNIIKDLKRKSEDTSAYHMKGTLEIFRNEEKYTYDVDSSYKKGDLFKVTLINQNNNHEQIILKNKDGVYVITPSLNKSFKFQSDWPYNNSQIYLLQPIINDLINDIVYPMYVPVDTTLSAQDIVKTDSGERVILTFSGESAFTVVQETLDDAQTTNYVYGDPYLILDTVGAITDYSVSWISNGVEYSVMSNTMDVDELLTVAQSISVKAVGK